jgi:drug/metabolite transporter (DMT)-like permease
MIGATSWGILWYPFRLMEAAGLAAPIATFLSYFVAVAFGTMIFPRAWREFPRHFGWLFAIALAAGLTNVTYLVAVMQGNVVRIVLLFFLAPLWTVPFARWLLKERLTLAGYATIALAMAGAIVMLWRPELGLPAPRSVDEWLGLVAGIAFALYNVLIKRTEMLTAPAKTLAASAGVGLVALPVALWLSPPVATWVTAATPNLWLIGIVGSALMLTGITLQYGLARVSANRAAVILLFELIVAAVAAHYLAGETTRINDWIGGAMIVGAGMVSTVFHKDVG